MKTACIGTGNVGRSWAVVFARAGHDVALWDDDPAARTRAETLIAATLHDLQDDGAIASATEVMRRIRVADSLAQALAGADHVQESVSERVEIKRALLPELDAGAPPDALIASSTSAIPGSAFMTGLPGSHRCLVAHPVNPPHLIPLVELCPTPETSAQTLDRAADLFRAVGQRPIRVAREIEGFVLNRLQWALLSEAMHLIGEGYCTPEDIDEVMTSGLALRWAFLGPLAVGHLNASSGLEGYFSGLGEAIGRVRSSLRTDYVPGTETIARCHAALSARMPVETLAEEQAKRDRTLLALRTFLDRTV